MQAQEWKALLEKYYRGESTLEEERRLKGYLAGPAPKVPGGEEPPADARWFDDLQKARAEVPGAGFDQALLAALRQTGLAADVDAAPPGRFRTGKAVSVGNWAGRIAAVLVVGVGLAWAIYHFGRNAPAPWREQTAVAAQTVPVALPDGTRVWLNAGSTLRYPPAFAGDRREVHLRGEAYFEVEPDAARPFRVHADQSVTEVLGTAFNVRNYPGEASVSVVVVSGKVAFASLEEDRPAARGAAVREKVLLLPGNGARLHRAGNALEKEAATDPNRLAWKTQRLVFKDLPLRQVIPVLENYYHTRIAVPNPAVLDCRFRGTFRAAALPQVLEVLAFGLDLTYARQPGGYVLTGRGCQP